MQGNAEIITKDRRLIERLVEPLVSIFQGEDLRKVAGCEFKVPSSKFKKPETSIQDPVTIIRNLKSSWKLRVQVCPASSIQHPRIQYRSHLN